MSSLALAHLVRPLGVLCASSDVPINVCCHHCSAAEWACAGSLCKASNFADEAVIVHQVRPEVVDNFTYLSLSDSTQVGRQLLTGFRVLPVEDVISRATFLALRSVGGQHTVVRLAM